MMCAFVQVGTCLFIDFDVDTTFEEMIDLPVPQSLPNAWVAANQLTEFFEIDSDSWNAGVCFNMKQGCGLQ